MLKLLHTKVHGRTVGSVSPGIDKGKVEAFLGHHLTGVLKGVHIDDFYLVNCYVPNSQDGLKRLDYRMEFEDEMRSYLVELDKKKEVYYCGDLNVAHKEIDLKNPQSNHHNPGFTDEERSKFSALLDAGFLDSFRHLYPDLKEAYSWWSYRFKARERNAGWRIDYFVVSQRAAKKIKSASIYADILGSDHCPVGIEI